MEQDYKRMLLTLLLDICAAFYAHICEGKNVHQHLGS